MKPNHKELTAADYAAIFKAKRHQKFNRKERDFALLDQETVHYLQADRQNLQEQKDQAWHHDQKEWASKLSQRLAKYYIVEDFFFGLAQRGKSTRIPEVGTQDIVEFLDRERALTSYKGKPTLDSITGYKYSKRNDKTELNEFFTRAAQAGLTPFNPAMALVKLARRLEPKQPSPQTLVDLAAFESYLNDRVEFNRLSPLTSNYYLSTLRTLLYDAEVQQASDPAWPADLEGLFSHPRWLHDWLKKSKNRSNNSGGRILARGTNLRRLVAIRHIFYFLKREGRVSPTYFRDLKEMFTFEDGTNFIPGRPAREIGALSEAEEERLFEVISRRSLKSELLLRDRAMIMTGITTTIRLDGLNSMRLENFKETEPGIWTCYVRIKRSSRKNSESHLRLAEDKFEWRDWYMSPTAMAAIHQYLIATGRDWQSTGPVWLTHQHTPLSYAQQGNVVRKWLVVADCPYTNPHSLRHTGIDRLVNKEALPIPVVQQISQHADPSVLLQVYAKGARVDAYRMVNKVFPMEDKEGQDNFKDLILAVNMNLQELSAKINRRAQDKQVFRREHAEEFFEVLRKQIERLVKSLEKEGKSLENVILSSEDYQRLGDVLQLHGLSYERVIGYEPKPQKQIVLKPIGRKPKPLFG